MARALSIDFIDAVKPILEDEGRTKIAHDIKAVTLELAKHGVEAKGFQHDVMLYAFLLCADPAGCSASVLAGGIWIVSWVLPRSNMRTWP